MNEITLLPNAMMLLKYQNFSRAAKALNISQPTLSRRIQLLEKMVGERLFTRDAGAVVPTQAGQILLKHARIMLASSRAMQEEIARHKGLMEGSLLIGAGTYPARALIAPAMSRFSQHYPGIDFEISVDDWSKIPDQLLNKDFDYVLMESSHLDISRNYELIPLHRHQAFFYCRCGHPLLEKKGLSISDVSQYPLICVTLPKRLTELFDKLLSPNEDAEAAHGKVPKFTCNDLGTMNATISQSNFIGLGTFSSLQPELGAGVFVPLPFRIPELTTSYDIVKRKGLSLSPAARIFMDLLIEIDEAQHTAERVLLKSFGPV